MASASHRGDIRGRLLSATMADDCWRRIGVQGDRSCERLAGLGHCRHCPTYAQAAAAWLDTRAADIAAPADDAGDAGDDSDHAGRHAVAATTPSLVIFRVGPEWLALPSASLQEIARVAGIRSLPHQRDPAIVGIVSLRGSLLICMSLSRLLQLNPTGPDQPAEAAIHRTPRMLIFGHGSEAVALPVDEVLAATRLPLSAMRPLPSTVERAAGHLTEALLIHQDRTVGLLDPARLRQALQRRLA